MFTHRVFCPAGAACATSTTFGSSSENAQSKLDDAKLNITDLDSVLIDLKATRSANRPLLSLKNVNHHFDNVELWSKPVFLEIRSLDKWSIAGRNGSGKSTLLRIILQKLKPSSGEVKLFAHNILSLDQALSLLPKGESLQTLWRKTSDFIANEGLRRTIAARSGLGKTMIQQNFETMSGGERMRSALVLLATLKQSPDLVILDEPSNHLDIDTLEVLQATLKKLPSAILVVSHDIHFLAGLNLLGELNLDDHR